MTLVRPDFPKAVDSSMRKSFTACPMQAYYSYFMHLKPKGGSIHLHFGGALAYGMEKFRFRYYKDRAGFDESLKAGMNAIFEFWGDFVPPEKSKKTLESCVLALYEYFVEYPPETDPVQPLMTPNGPAIEFNFALPIPGTKHPQTGDPILYYGRFDMLGVYQGATFIVDEKTSGSLGQSWAKSYQLASQFSGYCVSGDTEVLTEFGWKRIDQLQDKEKIAQWDNNNVSFVEPTAIHNPNFQGDMYNAEGKISLLATPDHRQLVFDTYTNTYKTYTLETLPKRSGALRFVSAGVKNHGYNLDEDFIRLLVAMQADGSWLKGSGDNIGARFGFKKQRKIERLKGILERLDITYNEGAPQKDGKVTISLSTLSDVGKLLHSYIGDNKLFGSWLLSLSGKSLRVFVEELQYWDGTSRPDRGWMYFSAIPENADWVRTAACLAGLYSSVHTQNNGDHQTAYRVNINEKPMHSVHTHTWGRVKWDGPVYCVTVPSSYFLIRRDGKVLVTGNCWAASQFGHSIQGAIIRGIAPLANGTSFLMLIEQRPQWMIDRWMAQLLRDIKRMIQMWEEGAFDYDLDGSCGSYGGCDYIDLCKSANPERWIDALYEVRPWDPLAKVGEENY